MYHALWMTDGDLQCLLHYINPGTMLGKPKAIEKSRENFAAVERTNIWSPGAFLQQLPPKPFLILFDSECVFGLFYKSVFVSPETSHL